MGRSRGTRVQVVGAAVVTVLSVALTGRASPAPRRRRGSTLAKNDPGIGSAEALENPQCDPATKRIRTRRTRAPLCVKAWKDGADNGGATAQGVTAKTIKVVVVLLEPAQPRAGARPIGSLHEPGHGRERAPPAPVDRAQSTRTRSTSTPTRRGAASVEFKFVKSTGPDETSQRADAVDGRER